MKKRHTAALIVLYIAVTAALLAGCGAATRTVIHHWNGRHSPGDGLCTYTSDGVTYKDVCSPDEDAGAP
jgi:hypothetical protein